MSVVFITAVLTRGTISLCYSLLWVCKDLRDVGFVIRGCRIRASHFFVSLHSIKKCLKFHDTAESPAESKNAGMINEMWCWSRWMCKTFLSSLQKFQVCICRIFCKSWPWTKLHAGRSCPLKSWVLANSPPETFLAIFKCTASPVEVKANSNTDKWLCQLRRHKHHAPLLSIVVLRLRVCSSEMGRIRPEGVHSCSQWICGCFFIPDKDNSHRHQWESLPVHHSKLLFFFFTHFTAFPVPIYLKHT